MDNILDNLSITPTMNCNKYKYENKFVPRVTEIISSMMHEDYIIQWANNLGFNKQRYNTVLNQASAIGTYTHNAIDKYIKFNEEPDFTTIPKQDRQSVYNTFTAFLNWWNMLRSNNKVNLIFSEQELVCPWFGGTLDLLLEINGKRFLFDFKSSNYPTYKFFVQEAGYIFMLEEYNHIPIDGGCGVLLLNKNTVMFNEMIADFNRPDHFAFVQACKQEFLSLVYSYYYRIEVKNQYNNLFGGEFVNDI